MSSLKQQHRIEAAIEVVDWTNLSQLSDSEIRKRWSDDPEASWPDPNDLAEFNLVKASVTTKPPQAAE